MLEVGADQRPIGLVQGARLGGQCQQILPIAAGGLRVQGLLRQPPVHSCTVAGKACRNQHLIALFGELAKMR